MSCRRPSSRTCLHILSRFNSSSSSSVVQSPYSGGKRVQGRKRFIATDSLGLLVDVSVTTANRHDTKGGKKVMTKYRKRAKNPRLKKVVADKGFRGTMFAGYVKSAFKAVVEIRQNHTTAKTGFVPSKTDGS